MEASGGDDREEGDEIGLLAEELVQLSVKGSLMVPSSKPTLICTVWTGKLYNPDSFRAHMKSLWKTRKKFEIRLVGQNLFLIIFEMVEDLELILEGRPWLFHKNLILFDRLHQAVERDQIKLTSSPFWIKIESCFPEFDKKYLLHAIGSTFGGVLRSEISEDFCRLRVNLDVQITLRRGGPQENLKLKEGEEMPEEQEGILEVEEAEKVNLKEMGKMLKEYAGIWRQGEAEKVSNCNREKSQNPNQEKQEKWISIQHGTTTTKAGNNTRKMKPIDADFTSDHTGK
ncbi:hypothetical protein GOBAR_DD10513 [Gossypium barbadense]|nr:hypothetical protein GOBAR_DD10513 [Gossypium barbadense]